MKDLINYTFKYLSGDIDKETKRRIEDDEAIMLAIITNRKDFVYYQRASKRLKTKFSFVSKLLDIFSPQEVDIIASYYFNNSKEEMEKTELLCLIDELYEKTDSPFLADYVDLADSFYQSSCDELNQVVREHYEEVMESRDEFNIVRNTYPSNIIRNFFARRRLDEIFLYGPMNSYEEFIHANFKTKEEFEKRGFKGFVIDILYMVDVALAEHVELNISLLDRYSGYNAETLENWDEYLDKLNREKVKDIESEMLDYIDKNHLPNYYFGFLPYVFSVTPHDEIFKKYGDVGFFDIREPKEFGEKRFCEIFVGVVNKKFAKDVLFGDDHFDNDKKCEIIDIAKVKEKK